MTFHAEALTKCIFNITSSRDKKLRETEKKAD